VPRLAACVSLHGVLFRPCRSAGCHHKRLVNRGTNWAYEYVPFVATDAALKILLNTETRKDGSLLARAPPAFPGRGSS